MFFSSFLCTKGSGRMIRQFYTKEAFNNLLGAVSRHFAPTGEEAQTSRQIFARSIYLDYPWVETYMHLASSAGMVLVVVLPVDWMLRVRALGGSAEAQTQWRKYFVAGLRFVDQRHVKSFQKCFPCIAGKEAKGSVFIFCSILLHPTGKNVSCFQQPMQFQCSFCAHFLEGPKFCRGCRRAQYCNEQCQKKHWRSKHKDECDVRKREAVDMFRQFHKQCPECIPFRAQMRLMVGIVEKRLKPKYQPYCDRNVALLLAYALIASWQASCPGGINQMCLLSLKLPLSEKK